MCSDGTCYKCRKEAADQNAREGTYSARYRWAPKPKSTIKKAVNPTGGDPLETNFLDWKLILSLINKDQEGGPKNKESK